MEWNVATVLRHDRYFATTCLVRAVAIVWALCRRDATVCPGSRLHEWTQWQQRIFSRASGFVGVATDAELVLIHPGGGIVRVISVEVEGPSLLDFCDAAIKLVSERPTVVRR